MESYEIWKVMAENPRYEVSNFGNVRKSGYWYNYDTGFKEYVEPVVLTAIPENNGYLFVNFESRHLAVHLLVAHAFLEEPEIPSFVQFIDGDITNCHADNLKYVTVSEFTKQKIADGTRTAPQPYKGKPLMCPETGEKFESIKVLCETLGLKRHVVRAKIIAYEPINGKHYQFVK